MSLWRTYRLLIGARVRSQLQYRTSLALELLATALLTFLDFVAILIIFEQVPTLAGWSVAEVALLYGIASTAFSLTDLAIGHLDFLSQMIRDGSFDQVLTRPLPSLLQVVTADFAVRRVAKGAQGLVVLAVALAHVSIDWTPGRVVMLPLAVLAGAVIYGAVWVGLATIAFLIVDAIEFVNAFTYGELPLAVPARPLRALAPEPRDLRPADRLRRVLSRALPPRPTRRAGAAAGLPLRLAARRRRRRRRCVAALGGGRAPLPLGRVVSGDTVVELRGVRKTFVVRERRGVVRRARRVVEAVAGIDLELARGSLRRLPRPERRRQVHDHEDADRDPRAHRRARCASPASTRRGSAWSSPGASASCSASGCSSGGTCRSPTPSSCCGTSTAFRRRGTARTCARFREVLELDPFLATPVRQLSLGQRIRGELTAVLLHDPELLFLDEPTIGLDVVAKQRVREFLVEMNRERGVTVLLTTHDLADVERLCRPHGHHRPRPADLGRRRCTS